MGSTTPEQLYNAFGAYVRSQRQLAQLTLRQAAELARISNPYLSQIEHGLALPSIAVLSSLANALSVSAETMLLRAAGLVPLDSAHQPSPTEESIRQDPRLDNSQKHALLAVLASFVGSAPVVVLADAEDINPAVTRSAVTRSEVKGSAEPVQLAARRGSSTRTTAGPAAAGTSSQSSTKGV